MTGTYTGSVHGGNDFTGGSVEFWRGVQKQQAAINVWNASQGGTRTVISADGERVLFYPPAYRDAVARQQAQASSPGSAARRSVPTSGPGKASVGSGSTTGPGAAGVVVNVGGSQAPRLVPMGVLTGSALGASIQPKKWSQWVEGYTVPGVKDSGETMVPKYQQAKPIGNGSALESVGAYSDYAWIRTNDGYQLAPSQDSKQLMEDDTIQELSWQYRNIVEPLYVKPTLSGTPWKADDSFPIPPAYKHIPKDALEVGPLGEVKVRPDKSIAWPSNPNNNKGRGISGIFY